MAMIAVENHVMMVLVCVVHNCNRHVSVSVCLPHRYHGDVFCCLGSQCALEDGRHYWRWAVFRRRLWIAMFIVKVLVYQATVIGKSS